MEVIFVKDIQDLVHPNILLLLFGALVLILFICERLFRVRWHVIRFCHSGGQHVRFWSRKDSSYRVIELTINNINCLNISTSNIAISVKNLGLARNWDFQNDGNGKHTFLISKALLCYRTPETLDYQWQQPHLNSTEDLWPERSEVHIWLMDQTFWYNFCCPTGIFILNYKTSSLKRVINKTAR